jgi:hypothetical protein
MKVKNNEKLHDQSSKELCTQRKHKIISQLKTKKMKVRWKEELHDKSLKELCMQKNIMMQMNQERRNLFRNKCIRSL